MSQRNCVLMLGLVSWGVLAGVTDSALADDKLVQSPVDVGIRNVLLIVSDDLRASTLACYGDTKCQTPNIDRLAKQGLLFESAYCQGTVCGPSRTSFMYSRYQGRGEVTLGQYPQLMLWNWLRKTRLEHGSNS